MKNKCFALIALNIALSNSIASARPQYLNVLIGKTPGQAQTKSCQTCHGGLNPKALNPFGQDYFKIFVLAHAEPGSPALSDEQKWNALLSLDSNKNGKTNREEFELGLQPGGSKL
jgi:hypothetical protein